MTKPNQTDPRHPGAGWGPSNLSTMNGALFDSRPWMLNQVQHDAFGMCINTLFGHLRLCVNLNIPVSLGGGEVKLWPIETLPSC